VDEERSLKKKN